MFGNVAEESCCQKMVTKANHQKPLRMEGKIILPDQVCKELRANGLCELPVYGFARCEKNCSVQNKCWVGDCQKLDRDVKSALALLN